MIPSFIYSYQQNNKTYLFFFPGINENNERIYEDIELNNVDTKQYIRKTYIDNSVEYIFNSSNIIKFKCNLINHSTQKTEYKEISVIR